MYQKIGLSEQESSKHFKNSAFFSQRFYKIKFPTSDYKPKRNIILYFVSFSREFMEWPQPLSEWVTSTEIVAHKTMVEIAWKMVWSGTLKRQKWADTIWPRRTWGAGTYMFSTNTISIRGFCKREMATQSTSNTNLK